MNTKFVTGDVVIRNVVGTPELFQINSITVDNNIFYGCTNLKTKANQKLQSKFLESEYSLCTYSEHGDVIYNILNQKKWLW